MQKVSFTLEIVVSDDYSTDRTPEIVAEYAARYPNLIKPILRKKNLGMVKNALDTIKNCSGEYIALMEGDDFWIDENKLQIQSDYLDRNTDCAICFTDGYLFFENDPGKKQFFYSTVQKPPAKFDLDFFIKNNPVMSNNTKMFRSEVQPDSFPEWIYPCINWDWVLHIMQALKGKIGFIDVVTLAYRRHPEAAFNSKSEELILLNGITAISEVNKYLGYKYNDVFKSLWWEHRELSFVYLQKGNLAKFLRYYWKYILAWRNADKINFRDELWRIKNALFGWVSK